MRIKGKIEGSADPHQQGGCGYYVNLEIDLDVDLKEEFVKIDSLFLDLIKAIEEDGLELVLIKSVLERIEDNQP